MTQYIIRRILYSLLVVVGVCVATFIITQMLGDPARIMLPLEATDEQVQAFRHAKGWDRPVLVQFVDFARNAIRLDFGESIWLHEDALQVVMEHFPRTIQLTVASMVLAVLIAVPLGVIAALRPKSALDQFVTTLGFAGVSVPDYFLIILLIIIFSLRLGWVKSSGYSGFDPQYYLLPAIALAARPIGQVMLIARSGMIDEMKKQYMVTAKSKGVPDRTAIIRHALRNAWIPIITMGGWQLTRLLAGLTVAVETISAWPGVGRLAYDAIEHHDLPLLQADVFFVALIVTGLNFLIDIAYAVIDPRIKYS